MSATAERPVDFLVGSEQLLEGLRFGGVGIWRWRVDSDEVLWTDNLESIHGVQGSAYDGTLDSFRSHVHPDDLPRVWEAVRGAVAGRTSYSVTYRTNPEIKGGSRWIETRGAVANEGDETWLTGICFDVSDRIRAEQELQGRLRQQKAIEELGSFAFGQSDLQAVADRAVEIAADVLEVPLVKILQFDDQGKNLRLIAGVGWRDGLVGHVTLGLDCHSQAGLTFLQNRPVVVEDLETDSRLESPNLLRSHGAVSGMSAIIAGEGALPFGVFGVHATTRRHFNQADTEFLSALANIIANSARQIAAVEHRQLLVREMAHRAGNLLQLVNTLAQRTFTPDRDPDEARRAFSNRLSSLSRANHLIAKSGWSFTDFSALAEETLEPFRDRMRLCGPDMLLQPELCFDLGLVLHELSTNAAKYGSLATENGEVELRWSVLSHDNGSERFRLEWIDEVASPPREDAGSGFGSKLMQMLIERKWGGEIEQSGGQEGYRFVLVVPLAATSGPTQDDA